MTIRSQYRTPSIEEMAEALRENQGFITTSARKLGIHRNTLGTYIKTYPELREVLDDTLEAQKDFAENALVKLIAEGNVQAIMFYLRTRGADRGWTEKRQIEFLVRKEVVVLLDVLQRHLTEAEYERILGILALADSPEAVGDFVLEAETGSSEL